MKEDKKGPLNIQSYQFALEIVRLFKHLNTVKKEYVLAKQILRSGTAIGANYREVEYASSKQDFIYKLTLSLKEANETIYWLHLLFDTEYITQIQFEKLKPACEVLISMLLASIKTAKSK
jgi:four helix bundle protein